MKPSSNVLLGLTAALSVCAGGARAQEIFVRLAEIRSAPPSAAPVFSAGLTAPPVSLTPSAAALPPALPAASAQLFEPHFVMANAAPAPTLAFAPAAPAAFATPAPEARSAAAQAAAPKPAPAGARAEDARANAARAWDGESSDANAPAVAEFDAVRRLAEPFRTSAQLAKLARTPRRDGASLRFAVIGDAEPGRFWIWRKLFNRDPGAFWKMLPRADRSGADFIVQLGDMVSRGVLRNFRAFFARLRAAAPRAPYLTVIGNHDRQSPHGASNSRVYRSLFGATNYAFDRGGRRFVVLDNSSGRVTPGQFAWLREVLSADKPAVVFTHMPPAPLGEWTNFGRKGSGGFRRGADEFMSLMSERKVARVYVGHVHGLGMLERGGVRYVLTGGGGSPLYPGPVKDRFFHYLTVDDGPDGLVETVHPAHGDSFILP
jgi:hypothetical protein